nr:MAG TPA: Endodeoxyribonuclease RusA [Caudoviricetes sp.]
MSVLYTERDGHLSVSITVLGEPVAQGRPRFAKRGSFVTAYDPPQSAKYKNTIRQELLPLIANKDFKSFDGPCSLELHVYRSIPKSFGRKKQFAAANGEIRPTTRPDTDNYVKGILDALNGIVVKDDSQIVDIVAQKFYSDTPRIDIVITRLME